ncbi:N-acetylmuramoyl-L-alanine amidase [Seohaeicola nanhaiensis]|uniref:N-acetylmuramoyl-L-alanine amidase n=1 Tax=Seohaeicola nanhaiensis TaxID=1387282 RepID=A0ABV9KPC7_9RHOB
MRLGAVLLALLLATAGMAQTFGVAARIDPGQSRIADEGAGARIELSLSQGVPYRVFTLDAPRRLVVDFQEVDWTGLRPEALLAPGRVSAVQFGTYVPGWSRLVAELAEPLAVTRAGIAIDPAGGTARLTIALAPVTAEAFAAAAGAPHDPRWDLPPPETLEPRAARQPGDPLRVVIDPGHGGIDPGAEAAGIDEKTLMLNFARELREVLVRSGGFDVVLTRDDDYFVSLERRIAIAHEAGADVFLSLHADSLSEGLAHGATVHVLSGEASDVASEKLAERHDRDDLLAGVDLSGADDEVTSVLLDLARQETQPRTQAMAEALVQGMAEMGGPMNRRPLRAAGFSVLKAADIPSVLIEIGFLTSPRDLKNLKTPEWRARMAQGIRNGLVRWRDSDAALRPLVRQ